jgi:hypothetical protein
MKATSKETQVSFLKKRITVLGVFTSQKAEKVAMAHD